MKNTEILGIRTESLLKENILDKIIKYIHQPTNFFHIVSLNPENIVVAHENQDYKRVVNTAQIRIIDGIGVIIAGRTLGIDIGRRITGVDLVEEMIKTASVIRLRVLFIGGRPNLAVRLAQCYQEKYPQARFFGLEGFTDIKNPQPDEESKIFSIVTDSKPHIIFAAFGSPEQELWLDCHKEELKGIIGMGVGGAFDYLSGSVPRAPVFVRKIGLEWLFRLFNQPWRWRRQLRLLKFIWLVIKEKLHLIFQF